MARNRTPTKSLARAPDQRSSSSVVKSDRGVYLGLFFLSAAPLAFEVTLTRSFALAQGHHFAFMAISLALLGGGASGTFLSLRSPQLHCGRHWLATSALLFTLSTPASYLLVNVLPFDMYRIAIEPVQLAWLALYYLTLTIPFFFSSLAVGAALVAWPEQASHLYAANLLGAALGAPLALLGLAILGGPQTVLALSFLGCLAFWFFGQRDPVGGSRYKRELLSLPLVVVCASLFLLPPTVTEIRLTPYQALSQVLLYPDSRIVSQVWNAFSRVDVVESQAIRSAPGLSMAFPGRIPRQLGLVVDGQNLSPVTLAAAADTEFTDYLPMALIHQLRPGADVLIIEPGGGLAVLGALRGRAHHVTVVQSNPAMVDAVRTYTPALYDDPHINLVVDDARSYLRRVDREFDLVVLPVTDSFRPVTAGAYALGEDYRYTVEAFTELWTHLTPRGLLVTERWLQLPPSESLRLWAINIEALRRSRVADPGAHLLALRSMQTSLIISARSRLDAADQQTAREFAASRQLDLIWVPDLQGRLSGDAEGLLSLSDAGLAGMGINRYNVIPQAAYFKAFVRLLAASDPTVFYRDYDYAVVPPTDDRPFFFHFFKWRQTPAVIASLGRVWQPFGGSGYLVLVLLLAFVLVLSATLILVPLALGRWRRDRSGRPARSRTTEVHYLLYFSLLGLGFLLVEIPLLQRFILYLGQPAYAFAVVVSVLLLASGLGSRYLSEQMPQWAGLAILAGLGLAYPTLLSPLFDGTISLPLAARIMVGGLALVPLGLLMGTPFPQGLARVRQEAPHLLPWVWAVNGCASVVSAVLAPMLAIDLGFQVVIVIGASAYLGALLALCYFSRVRGTKATPPQLTF
jgi:spermidine synthase